MNKYDISQEDSNETVTLHYVFVRHSQIELIIKE